MRVSTAPTFPDFAAAILTLLLGDTGGSGSLALLADLLETRKVALGLGGLAGSLELGVALSSGLLLSRFAIKKDCSALSMYSLATTTYRSRREGSRRA